MLTVGLFGDFLIGSLLIRGGDRFDRYLGKRYPTASRFCTFYPLQKKTGKTCLHFRGVVLFRERDRDGEGRV